MSTIAVLITALALAMDAMSLSIYQGIASTENQRKQNFIKIILTFGIFQFAMALVGSLSGSLFVHYISLYSKYISFAIFLFFTLKLKFCNSLFILLSYINVFIDINIKSAAPKK